MAKRKILIAGASGLVGYAAVRHFAKLEGWEVVAVSRRTPDPIEGAAFISIDLLDARRCDEVFSQMADVTHVVYAAVNEKPNLLEGWLERKQMEVNLSMVRNLFDPLHKVAKNLKHVTVLQGTKVPMERISARWLLRRASGLHAIRMKISIGTRRIISARSRPGAVGRGPSCGLNSCSARPSEAI
jgi:NAD dependent epimerase/dehydratase family